MWTVQTLLKPEKISPEETLSLLARDIHHETMTNAFGAREWFLKSAKDRKRSQTFVALSQRKSVVDWDR